MRMSNSELSTVVILWQYRPTLPSLLHAKTQQTNEKKRKKRKRKAEALEKKIRKISWAEHFISQKQQQQQQQLRSIR